MLVRCWPTVCDARPTLNQQWVNWLTSISKTKETLHQWWFDIGPVSQTLGQHQANIGPTSRACWQTGRWWQLNFTDSCLIKTDIFVQCLLGCWASIRDVAQYQTSIGPQLIELSTRTGDDLSIARPSDVTITSNVHVYHMYRCIVFED